MKTPTPRRPRPAKLNSSVRRPAPPPPPKCKGRPTYIVDDIVDFR